MKNYTKLETATKYYKIFIHKDLFGNTILTRSWGSKFSRRSNFKHQIIKDDVSLDKQFNSIIKKRISHHYKLV
jgi:hypothetical protein